MSSHSRLGTDGSEDGAGQKHFIRNNHGYSMLKTTVQKGERMVQNDHLVRAYGRELFGLRKDVLELGDLTLRQFQAATAALREGDVSLGKRVLDGEKNVNARVRQLVEQTVFFLAMRQPVARDLREVVAAQRIAAELERIGDYSVDLTLGIDSVEDGVFDDAKTILLNMAAVAGSMHESVLTAYAEDDVALAEEVWGMDEQVNACFDGLMAILNQILTTDNPGQIKRGTNYLLSGRSLERIGDHIKNIAENIITIVTGQESPFG